MPAYGFKARSKPMRESIAIACQYKEPLGQAQRFSPSIAINRRRERCRRQCIDKCATASRRKSHWQHVVSRRQVIQPPVVTDKGQISCVHIRVANKRSECPKQRRAGDSVCMDMLVSDKAPY